MPSWWLRAVAGALTIALLGTAFFAYRLSDDLSASRATIATQRDQLTASRAQLDAATARGEQLTSQVGSLQAQFQQQRDCVAALGADASLARQIQDLQTQNYNLSAKGSVWVTAVLDRDAALNSALDDYFQAYRSAFNGSYSAANTWISRGNAQVDIANTKLDTMNAEVAKMNALKNRIEGMLATAGSGLGVCASSTSSS